VVLQLGVGEKLTSTVKKKLVTKCRTGPRILTVTIFRLDNLKGKERLENPDVYGKIILVWMLGK